MPFVPATLFEAAVDALRGRHPLSIIVIPAMVRSGVSVVAAPAAGVLFGSPQENEVFERFFKIPGGPEGKPYLAIWETRNNITPWKNASFAGSSLQAVKKERVKEGKAFFQDTSSKGVTKLWGLRSTIGEDLKSVKEIAVRIADLAIWYGRNQDVSDLPALIEWFMSEFPIDKADLVGKVYLDEIPPHYLAMPFAPDPLTQTEIAEALGSAPAPPDFIGTFADLGQRLEDRLVKAGFETSEGLVERVVSAWVRGDIVVLVGQGGTGKTYFARLIRDALSAEFGGITDVWVGVQPEFDEADLVGYEHLDGTPKLQEFAEKILCTGKPLAPHLVVLEEFNLALLEQYFSSVLIASQDVEREIRLPGGEVRQLPVDTFFLATCNSYLDEPETRFRVSNPSKRRSSIIVMPNVLLNAYNKEGTSAISRLAVKMIEQERGRVYSRISAGLGTSLDAMRGTGLSTVRKPEDFSTEARKVLEEVGRVLLESPEGKEFFTLALLHDIAVAMALADRSAPTEIRALVHAIGDKLSEQLRGPKARAEEIAAIIRGLPNSETVIQRLDRMQQGPGDQLMPLL